MLYTEQEANTIIGNPKNLVNQFGKNKDSQIEVKEIDRSGIKIQHRSPEERVLIGTLANSGIAKISEIAKEFNLNRATVSDYSDGRTAKTSNIRFKEHSEFKEAIEQGVSRVSDKAIEVLMNSLGVITEEKLAKLGAKDASIVASNTSRVIANCNSSTKSMEDNRIQVIMYSPPQKDLNDYKVVEL